MLESSNPELAELTKKLEALRNQNTDREIVSVISVLVTEFAKVYKTENVEERRMIAQLSRVETTVERLSVDMISLCKIVKDGNGQPSLLQRITAIENHVASHEKDIKELEQYSNVIVQTNFATRKDLLVGMFAVIAGLVTLYIGYISA